MAGLIYYLPGMPTTATIAELRAAGLGHAIEEDVGLGRAGVMRGGPDGGAGLIVGYTDRLAGQALGMFPDGQRWERMAWPPGMNAGARGAAWVGWWPGSPPRPEELARARMLTGHWVTLADGQGYLVPTVRRAVETSAGTAYIVSLPHTIRLDAAGEWRRNGVIAVYQDLWRMTERWAESFFASIGRAAEAEAAAGAESVSVTFAEEVGLCAAALTVNYRLGPTELSALGLLDETAVGAVLGALIDLPRLRELQKKSASPPGG